MNNFSQLCQMLVCRSKVLFFVGEIESFLPQMYFRGEDYLAFLQDFQGSSFRWISIEAGLGVFFGLVSSAFAQKVEVKEATFFLAGDAASLAKTIFLEICWSPAMSMIALGTNFSSYSLFLLFTLQGLHSSSFFQT